MTGVRPMRGGAHSVMCRNLPGLRRARREACAHGPGRAGCSVPRVRLSGALLTWVVSATLCLGLGGCGGQSMFTSSEPIVYEACELADFQVLVWRRMARGAEGKDDLKTRDQATWVQSRIIAGSPSCFDEESVRDAVARLTEEPPGD